MKNDYKVKFQIEDANVTKGVVKDRVKEEDQKTLKVAMVKRVMEINIQSLMSVKWSAWMEKNTALLSWIANSRRRKMRANTVEEVDEEFTLLLLENSKLTHINELADNNLMLN